MSFTIFIQARQYSSHVIKKNWISAELYYYQSILYYDILQRIFVYINFFSFPVGLGPTVGFLPTIAKQLGYSLTTYGASMTFMSAISTIFVPLSGVIVDKFRIKKSLFLVSILGLGVVSALFLFVPKAPLDVAITELKCDAQTTTMTILKENNNLQSNSNVTYYTIANHTSGDELITCKVRTI